MTDTPRAKGHRFDVGLPIRVACNLVSVNYLEEK